MRFGHRTSGISTTIPRFGDQSNYCNFEVLFEAHKWGVLANDVFKFIQCSGFVGMLREVKAEAHSAP